MVKRNSGTWSLGCLLMANASRRVDQEMIESYSFTFTSNGESYSKTVAAEYVEYWPTEKLRAALKGVDLDPIWWTGTLCSEMTTPLPEFSLDSLC